MSSKKGKKSNDSRWEWLDKDDDWFAYNETIKKILETEYENGNNKANFNVNNNQFEVDFIKMVQKTVKTCFERPIRYSIKYEEDDNYYSWQWQNDDSTWVYYPPDSINELEKEYNAASNSFNLKINKNLTYEINFSTMKQINKKTKFSRKIKRVKSECKTDIKTEINENEEEKAENDVPSRNLRKRKQQKSTSIVNLDNDDNESNKSKKAKKILVKKETSSSSSSSSSADKEENVEIKIEKKENEELIEIKKEDVTINEETKKENKKAKGKLKKEINEIEIETEIDDNTTRRTTRNKKKQNIKKEEIKEDDEVEEEEEEEKEKQCDDNDKESKVFKSQANFEKKILKDKPNDSVKTVKFTGKVPVDDQCIEMIGNDYHIYVENDVVYDCMLNQTNLQFNNNKYYLLQIVEHNKNKTYNVWFRWGRVGKSGQSSLEKCGSDLEKAKNIFCRKFADKTKNEWEYKDEFVKVPGKYDIVHKDYNAENEEEIKKEAEKEIEKPEVPDSKLDKRIQNLIELICNVQNMEDMLKELKYDTKKAPLGKLSSNQIKAGYAALKKIENFINNNNFSSGFINACNEFYTRIPHDFGMRVPTPIKTEELLKEKLELLEALADIEVAVKLLNQKSNIENPIDRAYEQLECVLKPLDLNDKYYKLISEYLQKTHAPTHCTYKMKILDIFEVHKQIEHDRYKDVGNRMLLWHGSRTTNWAGILSQGLKIAPPEAPVTGYMFGKGCYFADISSKSANYCYASMNKNIGLVSLSEVSLGECNELLHSDYNADKLPKNKSSTKGLGKTETNSKEWKKLDDGVIVPIGDLVSTDTNNLNAYSLLYNEYVVYDVSQIKTRFLVKIEFDFE